MDQNSELLKVPQVAELLGLRLATVYVWLRRGQLGFVRVGGHSIRVPRTEVDRVLEFMPARRPCPSAMQRDWKSLAANDDI